MKRSSPAFFEKKISWMDGRYHPDLFTSTPMALFPALVHSKIKAKEYLFEAFTNY